MKTINEIIENSIINNEKFYDVNSNDSNANQPYDYYAKTNQSFIIKDVETSKDRITVGSDYMTYDEIIVNIEFCTVFSDDETFFSYVEMSVYEFCEFINKHYVTK